MTRDEFRDDPEYDDLRQADRAADQRRRDGEPLTDDDQEAEGEA